MTNEKKQDVIGYMPALTIEISLSTEGGYIYKVWDGSLAEAAERDEEGSDEGDDNGGLCTGNMGDAIGMAADAALTVARAHFSDNCFNNDVCPSSLDENGEPSTDGETAHKWDETSTPVECSECGTTREDEFESVNAH